MDLNSGVSLGQLLLALAALIGSGGLTLGGALQRIKTLEKEVAALSGFAQSLAAIDERTKGMQDDLKAIKESWLFREPANYDLSPKPRRRAAQ